MSLEKARLRILIFVVLGAGLIVLVINWRGSDDSVRIQDSCDSTGAPSRAPRRERRTLAEPSMPVEPIESGGERQADGTESRTIIVTGLVVDWRGRPAVAASVDLRFDAIETSGKSDATGRFEIGVPVGDWAGSRSFYLRAAAAGGVGIESFWTSRFFGESADVGIVGLVPAARLRISLASPPPCCIECLNVLVLPLDWASAPVKTEREGTNGPFVTPSLPRGAFEIQAFGDAGFAARSRVSFDAVADQDVILETGSTTNLRLRLTDDETDEPLQGTVTVQQSLPTSGSVRRWVSMPNGSAVTGPSGFATTTIMQSGLRPLRAVARCPGYKQSTVPLAPPSEGTLGLTLIPLARIPALSWRIGEASRARKEAGPVDVWASTDAVGSQDVSAIIIDDRVELRNAGERLSGVYSLMTSDEVARVRVSDDQASSSTADFVAASPLRLRLQSEAGDALERWRIELASETGVTAPRWRLTTLEDGRTEAFLWPSAEKTPVIRAAPPGARKTMVISNIQEDGAGFLRCTVAAPRRMRLFVRAEGFNGIPGGLSVSCRGAVAETVTVEPLEQRVGLRLWFANEEKCRLRVSAKGFVPVVVEVPATSEVAEISLVRERSCEVVTSGIRDLRKRLRLERFDGDQWRTCRYRDTAVVDRGTLRFVGVGPHRVRAMDRETGITSGEVDLAAVTSIGYVRLETEHLETVTVSATSPYWSDDMRLVVDPAEPSGVFFSKRMPFSPEGKAQFLRPSGMTVTLRVEHDVLVLEGGEVEVPPSTRDVRLILKKRPTIAFILGTDEEAMAASFVLRKSGETKWQRVGSIVRNGMRCVPVQSGKQYDVVCAPAGFRPHEFSGVDDADPPLTVPLEPALDVTVSIDWNESGNPPENVRICFEEVETGLRRTGSGTIRSGVIVRGLWPSMYRVRLEVPGAESRLLSEQTLRIGEQTKEARVSVP